MAGEVGRHLAWFGHYIFGDPKPDLAAPSVPKKADAKDDKKGGAS